MKALGLGLIVVALIGCGGSGNSSNSLFQGHFAGNWFEDDITPAPPTARGTIDIAIDSKGRATGTFTEIEPSRTGTLTGRIDPTGELAFQVAFQPDTIGYSGNANLTATQLTGTFGMNGVGYVFFPSFKLDRQP